MIQIVEEILGIALGETPYDDLIVTGALMVGITSILLFISVFKKLIGW